MDYITIQDGYAIVDIWIFILVIIIPAIAVFIIQRYLPRIFDLLERGIVRFFTLCVKKVRNFKIYIYFILAFRKLDTPDSACGKENLDKILELIDYEVSKKYATQKDLVSKLLRCCESKNPELILKILDILYILIKTVESESLKMEPQKISKILDLYEIPNKDIRRKIYDTLILMGAKGIQKEVFLAMIDEKKPEIEFFMEVLYHEFLHRYNFEKFIDDLTIQPVFRLLHYNDANHCLRYNLLAELGGVARGGRLKLFHIINFDRKYEIKNLLANGEWDERSAILYLFSIFVKNEAKLIIDSGYMPLILKNYQDSNEEVQRHAKGILSELLRLKETKDCVEKTLEDNKIVLSE